MGRRSQILLAARRKVYTSAASAEEGETLWKHNKPAGGDPTVLSVGVGQVFRCKYTAAGDVISEVADHHVGCLTETWM